MAEQDYVRMMRESLEKKLAVLEKIRVKNHEQNAILQDSNASPEEFEENIEKKSQLIAEMTALDDGFERMYGRLGDILKKARSTYSEEIRKMQMLISEITDLSVAIQAQEKRNQELAKKKFQTVARKAQKVRKSQRAVNTYYRNMMNRGHVDPQFLDHKE